MAAQQVEHKKERKLLWINGIRKGNEGNGCRLCNKLMLYAFIIAQPNIIWLR